MNRIDILQEAIALTGGDRQEQYGECVENHQNIANLWGWYLGITVTAADVAILMALLKIARIQGAGKVNRDSYVDACAYIAIAAECARCS